MQTPSICFDAVLCQYTMCHMIFYVRHLPNAGFVSVHNVTHYANKQNAALREQRGGVEKKKAENAILAHFIYFVETAGLLLVKWHSKWLRDDADLFRISSSRWARERNILTEPAGASIDARPRF